MNPEYILDPENISDPDPQTVENYCFNFLYHFHFISFSLVRWPSFYIFLSLVLSLSYLVYLSISFFSPFFRPVYLSALSNYAFFLYLFLSFYLFLSVSLYFFLSFCISFFLSVSLSFFLSFCFFLYVSPSVLSPCWSRAEPCRRCPVPASGISQTWNKYKLSRKHK